MSYTPTTPPSGAAGGDLTGTYPDPTLAAGAVSDADFRDSAGLSIVGRAANTTGDVADITAASDGDILRRFGTSVGFGSIVVGSVPAHHTTHEVSGSDIAEVFPVGAIVLTYVNTNPATLLGYGTWIPL
jgi:hypothetical protein